MILNTQHAIQFQNRIVSQTKYLVVGKLKQCILNFEIEGANSGFPRLFCQINIVEVETEPKMT